MPGFIIERNVPGADMLSPEELQDIAAKSNAVVAGLGEPYRWVTSHVAGDKIYSVHEAASADVIRRHAREGGFPADSVVEVAAIIDPSTADGGNGASAVAPEPTSPRPGAVPDAGRGVRPAPVTRETDS